MAKRQVSSPPQPRRFGSAREVDQAIAQLSRRVAEVEALDPTVVRFDDPRVTTAESNIRSTIFEVFGAQSPEYAEHQYHDIDYGTHYTDEDPRYSQKCFADGRPHTIGMLNGLINRLREKRLQFEQPQGQATIEFRNRTFHPVIVAAAERLFDDGHYAQAVFEAAKALIDGVKRRSGRGDLDGAALMRTVFSRNNPKLGFNPLGDQSDLDEQEGLMHLFEGAALAVRNPRGHRVGVEDDARLALDYLSLLSLLAGQLDRSIVRP